MTAVEYLYVNVGGMVACPAHGGGYLKQELERRPDARRITTPLDSWTRVPVGYVEDGFEYKCETCHPFSERTDGVMSEILRLLVAVGVAVIVVGAVLAFSALLCLLDRR